MLHAIVPVEVRQRGNKNRVRTYAFYDNGSSGCFITNDLLNELQAVSTPVTLQLRTMHGENLVQCSSVDDLIVSDVNGCNDIQVKRLYSQGEIPVSHDQIPRKEMLLQLPRLKALADHLPPYFSHLQIGLLIGSNCPRALEPLEISPGEEEGPYAVRLRHGWTIHGPLSIPDSKATVHTTAVKEITVAEHLIPPTMMHVVEDAITDEALLPDLKPIPIRPYSCTSEITIPTESMDNPARRSINHWFSRRQVKLGFTVLLILSVLFASMSSRAVHLEDANSLDVDSCINAIRCFAARRGSGSLCFIHSDDGTRFISVSKQTNWESATQMLMQEGITRTTRNPRVGDIVLVSDESPRCQWPLERWSKWRRTIMQAPSELSFFDAEEMR